ncbi:MAG TPA: NotI family restriction endonuclease [Bacillota bacterium]|nr:NotI family restriction endonuclease [Bacillota bacterium]
MSAIVEFYGYYVKDPTVDWKKVVENQVDKYTGKRSIKIRKSEATQTIGTTVVRVGKDPRDLIVDPTRFLEAGKVFVDCLHLLKNHEPGNELHLVPEMPIPGGNVDFFLVSARDGKVIDFVGIELQALDTTGSLWSERLLLLKELGLNTDTEIEKKNFGINWKMTAKTTLVQLHHKLSTFEHLNKHFVLVLQDHLLNYMEREFDFSAMNEPPRAGDSMQIHAYRHQINEYDTTIKLSRRLSTDIEGVAKSLGLRAEAKVELEIIVDRLEKRISDFTRFTPITS